MKRKKLPLEERKRLFKEIVWPSNEPLMFERRRGRSTTDVEEQYKIAHSEENVKKMADVGVELLGNVHFYKGFGFELEKEEMQNTKKLAELAHKYGIKFSVYVGSTMFIETIFASEPKSKEWWQRDQDGAPITYSGHGTYRYLSCQNQESYIEYMKKILKYAVEEIKADRIFFDNPGIGKPEPQSCQCPACVRKFREFLRKKYDNETLRRRLGFTTLDGVVPPRYDAFNQPWTMATIDDPLRQEWIDFRCQTKVNFYRKMNDYIKKLDPSVPVSLNIKGVYGRNRAFIEAIDHARFEGICEDMVMDSGVSAGVAEDGALVSEIRSFKAARTLNMAVHSPPGGDGKIEWATAIAFNKLVEVPGFGYDGGPFRPRGPETLCYYDFFTDHRDLYTDTENIADAAILRSFASMAYNNYDTHLSTILFEQTLIQAKVPFDVIFDKNLKNLSKWKVLVLANQESLSDAQLELIRGFVKKGGGLVATEATSLYDEWRRSRRQYGLADLFGFEKPGEAHKNMNVYGDGRVVYIPKIEPSKQVSSQGWIAGSILETVERAGYAKIQPDEWKLPGNWYELVEAVEWVNGDDLFLKVYAPLTVVSELLRKEDKKQVVLHLVNFDDKSIVKDLGVDLGIPQGTSVEKISILSPDWEGADSMEYTKTRDRIFFKVPELITYNVILIQLG